MAKTRLQEKYLSEAVKGMMDKFNYKNVMEIPKIEKVVINMGRFCCCRSDFDRWSKTSHH